MAVGYDVTKCRNPKVIEDYGFPSLQLVCVVIQFQGNIWNLETEKQADDILAAMKEKAAIGNKGAALHQENYDYLTQETEDSKYLLYDYIGLHTSD